MPEHVTVYDCAVWLAVGFFVGLGWAVAQVVVARLFR